MKTFVKWTVSDYHKMIESDILTGRNCELIDGEIIEMSPELPEHYNTAKRSVNYAEIAEYWVINLPTQELIVFRNPNKGNYSLEITWQEPIINSLAFPNIDIIISQMLS
jgi:Uma2 family endonuclease